MFFTYHSVTSAFDLLICSFPKPVKVAELIPNFRCKAIPGSTKNGRETERKRGNHITILALFSVFFMPQNMYVLEINDIVAYS